MKKCIFLLVLFLIVTCQAVYIEPRGIDWTSTDENLSTSGNITIDSDTSNFIIGTEGTMGIEAGPYDAATDNLDLETSKTSLGYRVISTRTTLRHLAGSSAGTSYLQSGATGGSTAGSFIFSGINGVAGTAVTFNFATINLTGNVNSSGTLDVNDVNVTGVLQQSVVTIDVNDATPDVSGGNIFVTSANGGAIEITDLDNPVVGQIIYIIGGSNTNSSTIADGGSFNLSAGWTASLDDTLTLFMQADNDYIEISRSDN